MKIGVFNDGNELHQSNVTSKVIHFYGRLVAINSAYYFQYIDMYQVIKEAIR